MYNVCGVRARNHKNGTVTLLNTLGYTDKIIIIQKKCLIRLELYNSDETSRVLEGKKFSSMRGKHDILN